MTSTAVQQNFQNSEELELTFGGIAARVKVTYKSSSFSDLEIYGPWASHTGYQSLYPRINNQQDIESFCQEHYKKNQQLCYLVGDEHKEHGWNKIDLRDGLWVIRIPCWASDEMKSLLTSMSFQLLCPIESTWKLSLQVEKSDIEELLSPLIEPCTRLENQDDLCRKLVISYNRSRIKFNQSQLSLFSTYSSTEPSMTKPRNTNNTILGDRTPLKPGELDDRSFDILVDMTSIYSEPMINALRDILVMGNKQITAATTHGVNAGKLNTRYHDLRARYDKCIDLFEALHNRDGGLPTHLNTLSYIPTTEDIQTVEIALDQFETDIEAGSEDPNFEKSTQRIRKLLKKMQKAKSDNPIA